MERQHDHQRLQHLHSYILNPPSSVWRILSMHSSFKSLSTKYYSLDFWHHTTEHRFDQELSPWLHSVK